MSQFSDPFSAAREAQMTLLRSWSASAAGSAEQMVALNLNITRTTMEKSAAAMVQLMAARDPRDLLALTNHTQQHFDNLLAYSRQLFGIASGMAAQAPKPLPKAAPKAPAQAVAAPKAAVASAPAAAPAAALAAAPVAEPAAPARSTKARKKPAAKAAKKS